MNKKILSVLLIIYVLFTYTYCYAEYSNYIWSNPISGSANVSNNISEEYTNNNSNPLKLDCASAILIEQTTGKVLYSFNAHEKLRPASVTKLMSILLIMESIEAGKISSDTKIPCSEHASSMGGSQIWLDTTETLSVEDMLKAICVVSANDCVTAMAEYIGGTEENFVNMMNEKAKELGMNDTNFKNCHGIDEDGHETSSYDIALMSAELLNKYPQITKYTSIWNDSLRDGKSELINTNKLVHNYSGCTGLKTGSTSLALFNLSASATRDNLSLIAVVMKAPNSATRFKCASTLLDFGFNNFEFISLAKKGDIIKSLKINKGTKSTINAIFNKDVGVIVSKGNDVNIDKNISLPDSIDAPISNGNSIGNVNFTLNDELIGSAELISDSSVDKLNIFSMINNIFHKWFNLCR